MPLERTSSAPYHDSNGIVFPMQDVRSATTVRCSISDACLEKLAGRHLLTSEWLPVFEEHRSRIERTASAMFDLGIRRPQLSALDL
jgi:hypothetical protein